MRTELFNLSLMADYDQLVCLTLTAIDKHWYQIETARKSLDNWEDVPFADEVGLGKQSKPDSS